MDTAGTPAECYVRAAVLCRRHVFICAVCAVTPGYTSLAFTLKDDRRDEIGLLGQNTDLQSLTFSFYLYSVFPSILS